MEEAIRRVQQDDVDHYKAENTPVTPFGTPFSLPRGLKKAKLEGKAALRASLATISHKFNKLAREYTRAARAYGYKEDYEDEEPKIELIQYVPASKKSGRVEKG